MKSYTNQVMAIPKNQTRQVFGIIGAALLLLLAGCDSPASASAPQIFNVSGTVNTYDGGTASGATVYLEKQGTNSSMMTSAGSNGRYTIPDVTAGTYTIRASLPGYDMAVTPAFTVKGNITGKDLTLQRTIHTVAFNVNGGDALDPGENVRTVYSGGAVGILPVPVREGYTFDGWHTEQNGGAPYTADTVITADITLYARWTAGVVTSYTVTFDVNGGDSLGAGQETRILNSGSVIGTLPVPTRTGYSFDGWYASASGGVLYTASSTATADITLYARWTAGVVTSYTVTFDVNGGDSLGAGQDTRILNSGSVIGTLPAPTRTGYSFDGWYASTSGGALYTASSTVTADITLYAYWTVNTYTVSFDVNGGDSLGAGQDTRTVNHGAVIGTLPVPTRAGYSFDGWYASTSGGALYTASSTVTADITLYAQWTAGAVTTYTVTFNVNGGDSLDAGQDTRVVNSGSVIGTLPAPTRVGYSFDGWYSSTSGGAQYTADTVITTDSALYAHWTINTYTVSFDVNGGDSLGAGQETRIVNHGATIGIVAPTRTGYSFDGWYTSAVGGAHAPSIATESITLYAHWTLNTYTVSFDVNEGNSLDAGQETRAVNHGAVIGTLPAPTRVGYSFDGWHTSANEQYTAAAVITESATLYAYWTINTYTITFDVNGGDSFGAGQETRIVNHGATIGIVAPTRTGYSFDGWYTSAVGGAHAPSIATESITLYAHWTLNTYTVSFDVNEGNSLDAGQETRVVGHGAAVGTLPVPTRVGFSFDGWHSGDSTQYFAGTIITEHTPLRAWWTINTYTVSFNVNCDDVPEIESGYGVSHGGTLSPLPYPTHRVGYGFDGWYSSPSGGTEYTSATIITESVALYAHWTLNTYTVTFDVNGGDSLDAGQDTRSVSHGAAVGTLPAPARVGYGFDGWYSEVYGQYTEYTAGAIITENVTLYALWIINTYTVTFDVNGGRALGSGQDTRSVSHGYSAGSLPVPTRGGYAFDGWHTGSSGGTPYTESSTVTESITLYAHWTLVTGNAGITIAFEQLADISINISPFTIYKTNHGDSAAYPVSQTITLTYAGYTNIAWYVDNDTTALANNTYSVTVNAAGYSVSAHTLTVEVTKDGKPYSREISFLVRQ